MSAQKRFKCNACGSTRRNENILDAVVCWNCGEVQEEAT